MSKPIPEVQIEPLEMKHAPAIQEYASDAAVAATTTLPHPYPEDGAVTFIERMIEERQEGVSFVYAVCDGDQPVGVCGVSPLRAYGPELGYWIGKPHWGRGYGYAGARAVLKRVFDEGLFETIMSRSLVHNAASIRILEKCGFQPIDPPEGEMTTDPRGELAYYNITKEQFREACRGGQEQQG